MKKKRTITPKQARALWRKALLSGKYKQGRNELRPEGRERCCLGVGCDVYRLHVGGVWKRDCSGWDFIVGDQKGGGGEMPFPVAEWFGVTSQVEYQAANDTDDKTFAEIAAMIPK